MKFKRPDGSYVESVVVKRKGKKRIWATTTFIGYYSSGYPVTEFINDQGLALIKYFDKYEDAVDFLDNNTFHIGS